MKKNCLVFALMSVMLLLVGCASMKGFLGEPEVRFDKMTIDSLSLEGITCKCSYSIKNPYPIEITISEIAMDIMYNESCFMQIVTDNGLHIAPSESHQNSLFFEVTYDQICTLAGDYKNKKSLPFTLYGNAALDISSVSYISKSMLIIPFSLDFDIPVFNPRVSISAGSIKMPTTEDIKKALFSSGLNMLNAAVLAGKLVSGKDVPANIFDGVNLDILLSFDLNIDNDGGAPWVYDIEHCRVDTGDNSILTMDVKREAGKMDSEKNKLQLVAHLNTLEVGSFIVKLLNKNAPPAKLLLVSLLEFTDLSYDMSLPLSIEKDMSFKSFVIK